MVVLPRQNHHFGRERPHESTLVFPPREANVREGWLKMTMKLLKETPPRHKAVVLPRQNHHFGRERPREITLVSTP